MDSYVSAESRSEWKAVAKAIIGHGTWLDKIASEIVARERKLARTLPVFRAESGLGASGLPHLGSLSDAVRAYGVKLATEEFGIKSELIAFSDDKDGLRKVPSGLPTTLKKFLGFPVTSIPDPFKCHESYGEHMSSLLRDALDKCGIEYTFISAAKAYGEGVFNQQIEKILSNASQVGEIIRQELGQEKFTELLPYFPVCSNCGRIYTTRASEFLPEEKKVLYICEGAEIKDQSLKGCGHRGEVDYRRGEGKLSWKVEFAARWAALGIGFEAYGKDIADSVRVNDRISQEILNWPPPFHVRYEMFLDKIGRKISKSAGNVFTPQIWLRYGSPQSLLLLMFKRVAGTRSLSITDIPQYMMELDELEDLYFGRKKIADKKELAKLTGLYKYCWLLKPPPMASVHVPYNLLVYLAKVAPKGSENEFIADRLRRYGYQIDSTSPDLKKRMEYALNWASDFAEIKEMAVELSSQERKAIKELVQQLEVETDENALQNTIYNLAKKNSLDPKAFFKLLYTILLGAPEGPRLGPYIVAMGRRNVAETLKRATATRS